MNACVKYLHSSTIQPQNTVYPKWLLIAAVLAEYGIGIFLPFYMWEGGTHRGADLLNVLINK